ncbi:Rv0361 family membrane protein [Nocardia sp. X0981]
MTRPSAGPPNGPQPPGGPQPGQPEPPPRPRKKRTGLIIGAILAVVVVAAGITAAVVLTLQGRTPLSSDERQVEAALRDFYGTLTDDGFRAATRLACRADRDEFAAMSEPEQMEAEKLQFSVVIESVDDIVVTGDRAKARITGTFDFSTPGGDAGEGMEDSSEESLVKEDGEWRVCSSTGAE